MKLVPKYQAIEVVIPAGFGATQQPFPDIPLLRSDTTQDVAVVSAEVFPAAAVPNSFSGNTNATLAQIQNAFVIFYSLGRQDIYQIPLIRLVQTRNEAATYYYSGVPFEFLPKKIDWQTSYIQFATPPNPGANFSFLFMFGYIVLPVGALAAYETNRANQLAAGIIPLP